MTIKEHEKQLKKQLKKTMRKHNWNKIESTWEIENFYEKTQFFINGIRYNIVKWNKEFIVLTIGSADFQNWNMIADDMSIMTYFNIWDDDGTIFMESKGNAKTFIKRMNRAIYFTLVWEIMEMHKQGLEDNFND